MFYNGLLSREIERKSCIHTVKLHDITLQDIHDVIKILHS